MITRKSLLLPIIALAMVTLAGCSSADNGGTTQDNEISLSPIQSISHAHGMAVDAVDSNKLYIATHNGLLMLENEQDLYRVGTVQDDFMGFSAHPEKPATFFTSGHPKHGGNLGIQRSDDGGMSWEKISDGVSGPIDFHTMTLSPTNPNLLYGWYGALQRSTDGGQNWELLQTSLQNVISLTANPHDETVVYATTVSGIQVSNDKGESWAQFSEELSAGAVTALAIDPNNTQNMLSFSEVLGLAKSTNGGVNWGTVSGDLGVILYFAFDSNTPNNVYALNKDNEVYKSNNGGDTWSKVK